MAGVFDLELHDTPEGEEDISDDDYFEPDEPGIIFARQNLQSTSPPLDIDNAKDLYKSCLTLEKEESNPDGSCNYNRRKLIWIDRESITHLRPDRECESQRNKGCTFGKGVSKGYIQVRKLSDSECNNKCVAGDWRTVLLRHSTFNDGPA